MTNDSPLPNNQPGTEPSIVDPVDELLSALTDGELPSDELIKLEEFAVDNDHTLDQLTAPFHATKSELSALLGKPAPSGLMSAHLAAALDAMDEPEVVSLAAARATRTKAGEQLNRSERLNRRLRQMSAVAAGFVVVAGVSLIALQGGIGGSDDSAVESAASDDGSTETTEASASGGDDAIFAEMAADDAMEEGEAIETAADEDTAIQSAPSSLDDTYSLSTATPAIQDLTLDQLSEETGLNRLDLLEARVQESATAPVCLAAAMDSGIDEAQIQRGIVVQKDDIRYELIVLSTEELRVFELPECVQID